MFIHIVPAKDFNFCLSFAYLQLNLGEVTLKLKVVSEENWSYKDQQESLSG